MAFPSVASITETSISTNPTSWAFDLPATVDAGDLLLLFVSLEESQSGPNAPTGWTQLYLNNELGHFGAVYGKDADGTEDGGTATITASSPPAANGAGQVYRITASSWRGTLADDVDINGTTPSAVNGNPNPPTVTAGWGAEDNLYIAACAAKNDDGTVDAAPTNYTNLTSTISGGGTNDGATVGTARRELNASSDNPGVFTLSETERHTAQTVVIRPAASAGFIPYPRDVMMGGMQSLNGGIN